MSTRRNSLLRWLSMGCVAMVATGCTGDDPSNEPGRGAGPIETPPGHSVEVALDERFVVGTDGAMFYLYHPDDLPHRRTSPSEWPDYRFACEPEFQAGRLVAFGTGGDGGYAFRATTRPLTERESQVANGSWDFRYVVRHGRVFFDGGYALPSSDNDAPSASTLGKWIRVPDGRYRVTVFPLDWPEEAETTGDDARNGEPAPVNYVLRFQPVDDLDAIPASPTYPVLELSREQPPELSGNATNLDDRQYEEVHVEIAGPHVVVVTDGDVPIPGFDCRRVLPDEFVEAIGAKPRSPRPPLPAGKIPEFVREQLERTESARVFPARITRVVFASSRNLPCLGVVVEFRTARRTRGGWTSDFNVQRFVTVTSIEPTRPWPTGTVVPLDRPVGEVPSERLDELKRTFAGYAKSNRAYRAAVYHPDFDAERVAAMSSPAGIAHLLIHDVPMADSTRRELLSLSDAERVERLIELLQSP